MIATDITKQSCSILTIANGSNHRKAYVNSPAGRAAFSAECANAENYAQVTDAWGNEAALEDFEQDNP